MGTEIALVVLLAAALNAGWNALIKVSSDRIAAIGHCDLHGALVSSIALPFVELPDPASWPLLALAIALHTASEKRKLARQLRYAQHSARLTSLSKQYDFGMVFFAAMGAVSLILSDANDESHNWLMLALAVSMMLLAGFVAVRDRKMLIRIQYLHMRWPFAGYKIKCHVFDRAICSTLMG